MKKLLLALLITSTASAQTYQEVTTQLQAANTERVNTLSNLQTALRHLGEEKQVLLQEVQFLSVELDKVKAELNIRKQLDTQLIAAHQAGEKNLEDIIKRFEDSLGHFLKLHRDVNNLMTV